MLVNDLADGLLMVHNTLEDLQGQQNRSDTHNAMQTCKTQEHTMCHLQRGASGGLIGVRRREQGLQQAGYMSTLEKLKILHKPPELATQQRKSQVG